MSKTVKSGRKGGPELKPDEDTESGSVGGPQSSSFSCGQHRGANFERIQYANPMLSLAIAVSRSLSIGERSSRDHRYSFIHSFIHPLLVPGTLLALQVTQAATLRDASGLSTPRRSSQCSGRLPTEAHLVSGGPQERRRWGQTRLQPGWRQRCGRGGRQFRSRCCRTRRRSGCAGDGRGWHLGRGVGVPAALHIPGSSRNSHENKISPLSCSV